MPELARLLRRLECRLHEQPRHTSGVVKTVQRKRIDSRDGTRGQIEAACPLGVLQQSPDERDRLACGPGRYTLCPGPISLASLSSVTTFVTGARLAVALSPRIGRVESQDLLGLLEMRTVEHLPSSPTAPDPEAASKAAITRRAYATRQKRRA